MPRGLPAELRRLGPALLAAGALPSAPSAPSAPPRPEGRGCGHKSFASPSFSSLRPAIQCASESLYDVLGIDRGASEQDIKKAYKRAALKTHPDKAPEAEREAYEERFKRVHRAYEILSDPQKRRVYDQRGEAAFDGNDAAGGAGGFPGGAGGFPGGDSFEAFRSMFGGGADFFGGGRRRTPDVGYALEISLEELFTGCKREVRYEQDVVCRACRGQGCTRMENCTECHGQGFTMHVRQVGGGYYTQARRTCQACGGQGAFVPPGAQCADCRGGGLTQRTLKLPVEVPPGCESHRQFVFRGKADESPGMETGDIIIEVREKAHKTFKRLGRHDILMERRVSLLDALTGVGFKVRHLDGQDLRISCPEGDVVRPGEVWSLKGQGLPKGGGARGDLYVRFEVEFPKSLSQPGDGPLREKLRPLLDPRAPAQAPGAPAAASGGWFSSFRAEPAADAGSRDAVASRMAPSTAESIERLLREQKEQEAQRARQHRQGSGSGGVECNQQ